MPLGLSTNQRLLWACWYLCTLLFHNYINRGYISRGRLELERRIQYHGILSNRLTNYVSTYLISSRPSASTKYSTNHWQASKLLETKASMVAIHSSVSILKGSKERNIGMTRKEWVYVYSSEKRTFQKKSPEFFLRSQICLKEKLDC